MRFARLFILHSFIVEDAHRTYVRYFMKLFAAQGATNHHSLVLASPLDQIESLVKDLPGPCDYSAETTTPSAGDQLDIAWRYKNLPTSGQAVGIFFIMSLIFRLLQTRRLGSLMSLT